uniref:tumor protein p63-regulated gene 1 protein isoform X1 n=1 Tax=Doryrhamphus excisus TaxID=161450 RepID=UPI0025ADD69A|nr:tumor protein p63-regulated gene 1 protein isoform X1 [Doryrhamphus excisus]
MAETAQVGNVTGDDRPEVAEQMQAEGGRSPSQFGQSSEEPPLPLDQFKRNKFFVLRPGTLHEAIKEVKSLVDKQVDGNILGVWLLAEVDHWNNEKERLAIITDNFLLLFKYDFINFKCEQIQKIPLNVVDRICYGTFTFPVKYLLQREGEGLRVFWDRLREPSFTSWWNPFATDLPYVTFTSHPVRHLNDAFSSICNMCSGHVRLVGDLGQDPGHVEETMSLLTGRSYTKQAGRGKPEVGSWRLIYISTMSTTAGNSILRSATHSSQHSDRF